MVNRRGFLQLLGMASTAYFFAPKGGWKSDVICTPHGHYMGPGHWGEEVGLGPDGRRWQRIMPGSFTIVPAGDEYARVHALDTIDRFIAEQPQAAAELVAKHKWMRDYATMPVWGKAAQLANALERLDL